MGAINNFGDLITCICELEDGTIIVAANRQMYRWHMVLETLLQTFNHVSSITAVIELKSDVIVSASWDRAVNMWRVSSGECLRSLPHCYAVLELVKLNGRTPHFASVTHKDRIGIIQVWDEVGDHIATYQTDSYVTAVTTLEDGSIVTGSRTMIEVWKP